MYFSLVTSIVTSALIKSLMLKKKTIRNLHVYTMLFYLYFPIPFTVISPVSRIGEGLAFDTPVIFVESMVGKWVAGWLAGSRGTEG